MNLAAHIRLMRPHQYVKNLFLFLPMFFAGSFGFGNELFRLSMVFVAYSLVCSAVYIFNDYMDIEADRSHPTKKLRPLASGEIKPVAAWIHLMLLLLISTVILLLTKTLEWVYIPIGLYLLINLAYTFKLKHIAILDISIIALGFILRLMIGAAVSGVPLSQYIVIMTFLLALFLALGKRRSDVILSSQGKNVRKSIDGYNLELVNGAMVMMASVCVVTYLAYCLIGSPVVISSPDTPLYYTAFFVVLGFLRYMQLTYVENMAGNPSKVLLKDIFLILILLGWMASFAMLLYFS